MTPEELRAALTDPARPELALLDAREQGVFSGGHLFHASSAPLSRLELMLGELAPRADVTLVWCDGGGGEDLAERAAARSRQLGYRRAEVLAGGVAGWAAAGGEVYTGVNVPSKAFGEIVEHVYGTPRLEATELAARVAAGEPLVILDSRPLREYRRMSIPGGVDCPGAELAYRVHDLAPDPTTLVVVNCAGRTRSIIGAQSLINAGIPNPVVALKNGTMGWELAGLTLEHGQDRLAPEPTAQGLARAQQAAERVAARFGVRRCSEADLGRWLAEADRTTFVLDVRSPEEFEAGRRAGSRSAPGGQLVQATDEYVGVRNARIVLVDDTGVRATMTASWLLQLGWPEVWVLDGGLGGELESGPVEVAPLGGWPEIDEIPRNVVDTAASVVLDLADSVRYRRGHVPGAWWAVRSRFAEAAAKLPAPLMDLVLVSPDNALARLAAPDARATWPTARVRVLAGGGDGWRRAAMPQREGFDRPTTTPDDVWYKPYDHDDADVVRRDMEDYLTWEVALVGQVERDPTVAFPRF
ncbi:MAG: rhodanese-like domain-containing protein [Acidimicrobiales bacterium]